MAEALDKFSCELVASLNDDDGGDTNPGPSSASTPPPPQPPTPLAINDVPNDVLVSIFMALKDPIFVRHTIPLVCKAWNELYCTKDASPLHETLEIDFEKEVQRALPGWDVDMEVACPRVHASRVISWAKRRSDSVRKLQFKAEGKFSFDPFSSKSVCKLISVLGPNLTEISIGFALGERLKGPFWRSLRDSVVPAGRLRSLVVKGINPDLVVPDVTLPLRDAARQRLQFEDYESKVAPLAKLAGSLEELELEGASPAGLLRFPEAVCGLTELRRLSLAYHMQIDAIPAGISSLKKLKELEFRGGSLSALPKELGELSGLTKLDLTLNHLGKSPQDEPFPAELGKLKSLRELTIADCPLRTVPAFVGELEWLEILNLSGCHLRTVPAFVCELKSLKKLDLSSGGFRTFPAFVGKLESLEVLDLSYNSNLQIVPPLDSLIEACPRLREVNLCQWHSMHDYTGESLEHIKDFKAKLLAKNPNAKVVYERE